MFPYRKFGVGNFSEDLKNLHIGDDDDRSGVGQWTALTLSMNLSSERISPRGGHAQRPHKKFRESFRRLLPSTDATRTTNSGFPFFNILAFIILCVTANNAGKGGFGLSPGRRGAGVEKETWPCAIRPEERVEAKVVFLSSQQRKGNDTSSLHLTLDQLAFGPIVVEIVAKQH